MRPAAATRAVLTAALLVALAAPAQAGVTVQAGPLVTISTLPAFPDGAAGWFVTEPAVYATVGSDADLGWGWETISATVTVGAGVERYLGDAPEGIHDLRYRAASAGGTTTGAATLKTDATVPSQPAAFQARGFPGPGVTLTWDASTDAISGVARYSVYRDTDGPPYDFGDEIATTTDTSYHEAGSIAVWRNAAGANTLTWDAVSEGYRYAVRALDVAGNPSLLTDAELVGGDFAALAVLRSVDGGPYSSIATLSVDASVYTDASATGEVVLYVLCGVDADGNTVSSSVPAPVVEDSIAPPAPAPALAPVFAGDGQARFLLTWPGWTGPVTDGGSGIASAVLTYGTAGSPTTAVPDGVPRVLEAPTPTALWSAQVRSEDRAGNVAHSAVSSARNVGTLRVAGDDRIATSRAVALQAFDAAETAVFASALDFPDALAASSLAGAVRGPVILVGRGPLPAATRSTLAALGVRNGYVIGGTRAVEPATFASIDAALAGRLSRVQGRDRYATAAAVARKTASIADTPRRAYLVSGTVFADALSVGPVAYAERSPILFANAAVIPDATLFALSDLHVFWTTVIVGGKSSVTPIADPLLQAPRIAGPDRYATSKAFADWAVGSGALTASRPVVVTGTTFPDGLSASPLAGEAGSPLLLASEVKHVPARSWLVAHRASLHQVALVGGARALSDALRLSLWSSVSKP